MRRQSLESRLLVLITLGLVAFGLVMVYSATSAPAALARTDPMSYLKKQGAYALIGVALMMAAARFDYRRLRLLAPGLVLTALCGCLAVLVIGVGSGGVVGAGLGRGVQEVYYLPAAHTDMIFAVIGEELGLLGVTGVIAASAALAYAGLRVALACTDPFGKRLAAGLVALV